MKRLPNVLVRPTDYHYFASIEGSSIVIVIAVIVTWMMEEMMDQALHILLRILLDSNTQYFGEWDQCLSGAKGGGVFIRVLYWNGIE